jgi:hypothetical protein
MPGASSGRCSCSRENAELDVGAAAGHVGRDHDGAELPRVLDDVGLALVLLGVEHLVLDAVLRVSIWLSISDLLDARRADEDRPARRRGSA